MRQPFFRSLRNAFVAGVIVLAPLAVTIWIFNWLIGVIGGNYLDFILGLLPSQVYDATNPNSLLNKDSLKPVWNLLATIIVLLLITTLGFLSRYVVTKFFFVQTERFMRRVPLIGAVYHTAKQIVATFSAQQRAVFDKVVLIPFPREGSYAIGFLTNRTQGEPQARTTEELWNIFLPTTPNPTSGYLIMVPSKDVIVLDMTVGEAMKLVISGGAVTPVWPQAPEVSEPTTSGTPTVSVAAGAGMPAAERHDR